jgi:uncharacterized membrane protein
VFDKVNGLPMHPLVVHAAVVFVPLLILAAAVYALVPRLRDRVGWVAALLAAGAPLAALVAMLSGTAFRQSRYGDVPADAIPAVTAHEDLGEATFWFSLGLGVSTGLLLLVTRRNARRVPRLAEIGLIVLVLGLAAVTGYYVIRTGDSGATSVHGG